MSAFPTPRPFFGALFGLYARWLIGRHFAGWYLRGRLAEPGVPTVYLLNHSAWWDAIAAVLLSRTQPGVLHSALMGEAGYLRFPFFGKLGAVPVPPSDSPRRLLTLFRELERRARAGPAQFWIFPQGEQRHPNVRPLGCERGASVLVDRLGAAGPCQVMPIALHYLFGEEQSPELFISIGNARPARELATPDALEALLTAELDRLTHDLIANRREGFATFVRGRRSVSERWLTAKTLAGLPPAAGARTPSARGVAGGRRP